MKIAIIRLSAMGDIFHMLWHINYIRQAYPDARIDFFVDSRFYFLLEGLVWFDNVYSLPLKKSPLKALKQIKNLKKTYDISIDYQGRIKSAFIANYLSSNSYGYAKNGLREKLAFHFYKNHCDCEYLENVYKRSLELSKFALKDLKIKEIKSSDVLIYNEEKTNALLEKIKPFIKDDFILLHNGSSKINKMLPLEKLISICSNSDFKFLLAWGNECELNRAKEIALKCSNAIVLPKISLSELVFLSKYAKLIIGNDSGTTHIAVVLNRPNITFLNESNKKPASRLISPFDIQHYFYKFSDVDTKEVVKIIEKVVNN
ncbi:lipopolysaccharide heptosyltransferase I [Campylobacter sp. Cr9]|uniref:glycosyltransferase family 9 protein n=1 Tax=Campylobacter sp. Cr9 TaxID=2735728 RepID=UPI00301549BB|nr:lipopolysaccharide heptosyltransferase I [Campylobacter sp. Cr9]